jgi:hypothetical protein
VHDRRAPVDGVAHADLVAHVALDDLQAGAALSGERPGAVEVLLFTGAEVVEHAHVGAARQEGVHHVRADEPGAAGDQDQLVVHTTILRHPARRRRHPRR